MAHLGKSAEEVAKVLSDAVIASANEVVDRLTPEQLEISRKCLGVPTSPGLYALVAPDEVVVRVYRGDEKSSTCVCSEVRHDVATRMLRGDLEEHVRSGKDFIEWGPASYLRFLELKKKYRLDKLG